MDQRRRHPHRDNCPAHHETRALSLLAGVLMLDAGREETAKIWGDVRRRHGL